MMTYYTPGWQGCTLVNPLCPEDVCILPSGHPGSADGKHCRGTDCNDGSVYKLDMTVMFMMPANTPVEELVNAGAVRARELFPDDDDGYIEPIVPPWGPPTGPPDGTMGCLSLVHVAGDHASSHVAPQRDPVAVGALRLCKAVKVLIDDGRISSRSAVGDAYLDLFEELERRYPEGIMVVGSEQ